MITESDLTPEQLEDVELLAWMLRERGFVFAMEMMFAAALMQTPSGFTVEFL